MSINIIYNKLYAGEVVRLESDKNSYETIRTGLIAKYKRSAQMMSDVGDDSMLDSYVSASRDAVTCIATFQIKPKSDKQRKTVSYKLL